MASLDEIPKTYEQAMHTLAEWHADQDQEEIEIYSFPDPEQKLVRLLEVSDSFPALGEIRPFPFGRSVEFPFRSVVAQITRDEWERARTGKLDLPAGWEMSSMRKVWP